MRHTFSRSTAVLVAALMASLVSPHRAAPAARPDEQLRGAAGAGHLLERAHRGVDPSRDLLDWRNGGTILVSPGQSGDACSPDALIGRSGSYWASQQGVTQTTMVLGFFEGLAPVAVEELLFRVPGQEPEPVRLREARISIASAGGPFDAGRVITLPVSPGLYRLGLDGCRATAIRIECIDTHGQGDHVVLGRVHAFERLPPGGRPALEQVMARIVSPRELSKTTDLASADLGARLLVVPPERSGGNGAQGLIGATNTVWSSPSGTTRATAVVGFFEPVPSFRVGAVAFTTSNRTPVPERVHVVRLSSSPDAAGAFDPVGSYLLPENAVVHRVEFPPRQARRVRVEMLASRGGSSIGLARIHVLEAPGAASALEAFTLPTGPVTATAPGPDLAAASLGARAMASGSDRFSPPAHLLDSDPRSYWQADFAPERPPVVDVEMFAFDRPARIGGLGLSLAPPARLEALPRHIEVDTSVAADKGYTPVGRFLIRKEYGQHRLTFDPRPARWVRVTVKSVHGARKACLSGLHIIEAPLPGERSAVVRATAEPVSPTTLDGRVNWLAEPRGASVVSSQPAAGRGADTILGPAVLLRVQDDEFGWMPSGRLPFEAIFRLAGEDEVPVAAVAFQHFVDERRFVRDASGPDCRASRVELALAGAPGGPFRPLGTWLLTRDAPLQKVECGPVRARYLKVIVHGNHGGKALVLGRVMALAPPGTAGSVPVDLLSPDSGGNLVRFSRGGSGVGDLTTPGRGGPWRVEVGRKDPTLPEFVYGFRNDRPARFGRLALTLPEGRPEVWPARVEVLASSGGVFAGFGPVAQVRIDPARPVQEFELGPVEARLVLFRFHPGPSGRVEVGRIRLFEGAGGPSVVDRIGAGQPSASSHGATTGVTAALHEREPNDTPGTAMPLAAGQTIVARIHPARDVDHFVHAAQAPGPFDLFLGQEPFLRVAAEVRDRRDQVVARIDPGRESSREALWELDGAEGPYTVRVSQPANSILMIFDSSGSMTGAYKQIEEAAGAFFATLSGDEAVASAIIGGPSGIELIVPFTTDKEELRTRTLPAIRRGGSSEATRAVEAGLKLLQERTGNRAVVIMSDFQESGVPEGLWRMAATVGARIYTVGFAIQFQSQWRPEVANTQERYMKNLAMATGGRYLYAPQGGALTELYRTIAGDLATSPPYRIGIRPPRPPGRVQVTLDDPRAARLLGSERALLIVLDASGSMNQKVKGKRKIDVAKSVIERLVDDLPRGMRVGLRAYGHRLSPKDRRTCEDRQLLIPVSPIDPPGFLAQLRALRARGETPMIGSVLDAGRDLAGLEAGERRVVLISDGLETCGGKPEDVEALSGRGVEVIRVDVVGFDINDPGAVAQLQRIAWFGKGRYYSATDSESLARALAATTAMPLGVIGRQGQEVASGTVGAEVVVPVGTHTIRLGSRPPLEIPDVRVESGRMTRVGLSVDQAARVRPEIHVDGPGAGATVERSASRPFDR